VLLRNEGLDAAGVPVFSDVGMALGADAGGDARGMAVADFDNDGDLDIIINSNPGDCGCECVAPVLLRNDVGQRRNWLAVDLKGTKSNRDAVGAVVTIEIAGSPTAGGPTRLMRHVTGGSGYASQNSMRLHFGLGDATLVTSLTIRWPSGAKQVFSEIPPNRLVQITEGSALKQASLRLATDSK
jgi:hypothetical protein